MLESFTTDHRKAKESGKKNHARICMLTMRDIAKETYRSGFYEAQDVLCDIDDVDLISVRPRPACERIERFHRSIVWRDFTKTIASTNLAYQPIRLNKEYDVFILYVQYHADLIQLAAVKDWKKRCKVSVLWIDEMWASVPPRLKSYLSVINEFDYIVIGLEGTVSVLSDLLKRDCHWVPAGVDAIQFSPYPDFPCRVIDIYSMGRIWEDVHQTFRKYAMNNKLFYIYDTFHASLAKVKNYREHRELYAIMAKRSKYYFVSPAKMNTPWETQGQVEIGMRYYEGLAAGTVMIGQAPDCISFKETFNWPDAVIEIKPEGSDAYDVLKSLSSQPERLLEISRRNAAEALLRHDWVYRWKKILEIAGLKPTQELEMREGKLKRIAEEIEKV